MIKKIFIGVNGLGRYGELLYEGLTEIGFSVDLCDHRPTRDITYYTPKYSICELRHRFIGAIKHDGNIYYAEKRKDLLDFIGKYDAFFFYFADTLLPGMLDVPLISLMGKKIVFGSAGDDTMVPYIESLRFEWRGSSYLQQLLIGMHDEPRNPAELYEKWFGNYNTLSRKLYMIRMIEHYGLLLLFTGSSGLAKKPFYRGLPICDPRLVSKGRHKLGQHIRYPVKLSHYSSNSTTKSTTHIEKLMLNTKLCRLQNENLLSFNMHEKLPQKVFFDSLLSDDVIIDQLAANGSVSRQASSLCTLPITGPNTEAHIPILGTTSIPSVEIFSDSHFIEFLNYAIRNLDVIQNYRDCAYIAATQLTPVAQATRLAAILTSLESPNAYNSWGANFLDKSLARLRLINPFIESINDYSLVENVGKMSMNS